MGNTSAHFKKSVSLSPQRTGFAPLLYAGRLEEGLSIISELGFEGVEISLKEPDEAFAKVVPLMAAHDLTLLSIATGRSYYDDHISLGDPQEQNRRACVQRMKAFIEFASGYQAFVIIGGIRGAAPHSPVVPLSERESQFRLSLQELLPFAQAKRVTLLLEPLNRYESMIVNSIDQALDLIESLGFSNFQILADTFHMNIEEASMEESLLRARDHLGLVHFADSNRLAPGWGHIAFPAIVCTLRTIAYQGFINVEVLPVPNDQDAARQSIGFIQSIEHAEVKA